MSIYYPNDDCLKDDITNGTTGVILKALDPLNFSSETSTLSIANATLGASGVVTAVAQSFTGVKNLQDGFKVSNGTSITSISSDVLLASASDNIIPTQRAVKQYADNLQYAGVSWQQVCKYFYDAQSGPIVNPQSGDRIICSNSGTQGGVTFLKNYIYTYINSTWNGIIPLEGWTCYIDAENTTWTFNGTSWVRIGISIDHNDLQNIGTLSHVTLDNKFLSTVDSSSQSTGAFTIAGGAGIDKNLNIGGLSTIQSTVNSTNTSTGALVISGGVGVGGDTYLGDLFLGSTMSDFKKLRISNGFTSGNDYTYLSSITANTALMYNSYYSTSGTFIVPDVTSSCAGIGISESSVKVLMGNGGGASPTLRWAINSTGERLYNSTTPSKYSDFIVDTSGNLTITGVDIANNYVKIANTTVASDTNSGALRVSGGASIGGKLYAGNWVIDGLNIKSSTSAATILEDGAGAILNVLSSANNGYVRVRGGNTNLGGDMLFCGESTTEAGAILTKTNTGGFRQCYVSNAAVYTKSTIDSAGNLTMTGVDPSANWVRIANTTVASDTQSGALQVSGGASIGGKLYCGNWYINGVYLNANSTSVIQVSGAAQNLNIYAVNGDASVNIRGGGANNGGQISLLGETVSGKAGAIEIKTGLGGFRQCYVSDTAKYTKTTVDNLGNITFTGVDTAGNFVKIANTTASSGTDSGAFIVAGGVGIGSKLYVGNWYVDANYISGTGSCNIQTTGALSNLQLLSTANSGIVTIRGGTVNAGGTVTLFSESTAGKFGCVEFKTGTGGFRQCPVSDITKYTVTTVDASGNLTMVGSDPSTNWLRISNTTESTDGTSGSLFVDGGLGVGKRLNVNGNLKIYSNVLSTSTSTGSIQVIGGIGIRDAVYCDKIVQKGTYYEDYPIQILPLTGGSFSVLSQYNNGSNRNIYGYKMRTGFADVIQIQWQCPHSALTTVTGAYIYPHVHVLADTTALSTTRSTRWTLNYVIKDINNTTAITTGSNIITDFTTTTWAQDGHYMLSLGGGIDVSANSGSFMLMGSITRSNDTNAGIFGANGYAGNFYIVNADCHYIHTTMGSTITP